MAVRNYINISKEGQLLNPVGTSDTTLTLSGSGLVNIPTVPFYIRIDPDTASEEVILVGAGSSPALLQNCTRGYDGTSAFAHAAGAKIRHCVVAEFFTKADTHVEATTNVHGLSGGATVVGTTSTQTLTNKTINASMFDTAHTTSPVGSQHYMARADSASSRNGFTWENTAGSTGKAFLARSAGVDKFSVAGDTGNVVSAGTGAFAGLDNDGVLDQTGATNITGNVEILGTIHASLGADFDSTLNADGNTTIGGTLGVTGATTLSTLSTSGAATLASATVTGAATVGGNATVTGDLGVTGVSNLTGVLTMILPTAGGAHSRILSNARTGTDNYFEGKNSAAATRFVIESTGRTKAWDYMMAYDGSQPVAATVSSTAVVPSHVAGTVIFDESDKLVKRSTGAAWEVVGYYGQNNYVRYRRATDQNLTNNTVTKLAFTTADVTDTAIVTVASNTDFTLVRAGLYFIEANAQHEADPNGSRWLFIADSANSANRYAVDTNNPSNTAACAQQVVCLRRFAAGSVISVWAYQDSGVTNPLTGSLPALCPMHVNITWLGP